MAGLIDSISNMINSFESTDAWYNRVINEMLPNGTTSNNSEPSAIAPKELLYFLQGYHYAESLLDIYYNILEDIVLQSSFSVVINDGKRTNYSYLEKSVNQETTLGKLKAQFLHDLRDRLYFGRMDYFYDYVNHHIYQVKGSDVNSHYAFVKGGKVIGIRTDDTQTTTSTYLTPPHLISYVAKPFVIRKYTPNEVKQELGQLMTGIVGLPNHVAVIEEVGGRGVLNEVIPDLYQLALHEFQARLLSYKIALKSDLILANIDSNAKSREKIEKALGNIEAGLNFSEYAISYSNPVQAFTKAIAQFKNSVKVLPSTPSIASLDKMDFSDDTSKLQTILDSIQNERRQILEDLGIPEELYSGNANKWEVISRSTRLLSKVQDLIRYETNVWEMFVRGYIRHSFPDINVESLTIEFQISKNNVVLNSVLSSQVDVLSQKINSISSIIQGIQSMESLQFIDYNKYIGWISDQLQTIDPSVLKCIDLEKLKKAQEAENPPEEDM